MEGNRRVIREFFERVHGGEPQGWLVVWTRQDKAARAFELSSKDALDRAAEHCAGRAQACDVYAAVGLQGQAPEKGSRGKEDGVAAIPGLWEIGRAHV